MEILAKDQYQEYESFVKKHENGSLTQSTMWHQVKANWGHEVVVVREENQIIAGISVLIKKVPIIGTSMLYAPRGPVCDYNSEKQLLALQKGIDLVAKTHNAHTFKMDPDVSADDKTVENALKSLGYTLFAEPTGFETIQTRFNYRLYINGRNEEELMMNMHHKTRYNIRLAGRRGVEVRVMGKEALDDFMKIMEVTGERDGFSIRSKAYFENMLDSLGESLRLYMAYYENKAIAGAITSNYAGKTCYIYGASDNQYRNVMAPYLIQWEMIKWALETDCKVYDFMGVSGDLSEDGPLYGLYRFKSGFNGVLEELPGEFDYTYKAFADKFVDTGIKINEKLRGLKRKLKSE